MTQVTFYVPCLNEARNIRKTLEGILAAASELAVSYEILVVDDCSTDETASVVEAFQQEHPDVSINLQKNDRTMGVGRNYVDGAFSASGEYYMMVCGDNTKSQDAIVAIVGKLGEADMIIPYFQNDDRPLSRRIISRMFVCMVNILRGNRLRYYNGLALHKRFNVMRWHPDTHGFGAQAELITRLIDEGASYLEVPIINYDREFGASSAFKIRSLLSVAHSLLEIFLRRVRRTLLGNRR